jgi:hydrogenase-4 component F
VTTALALGLLPIVLAVCALLVRDLRPLRAIGASVGVAQIGLTLAVSIPVLLGRGAPGFLAWFRLDGMAAWMVGVNSLVFGAAVLSAALLLDRPEDMHVSEKGVRALFGLAALFLIAANGVVCAADLGAMWVAMEATTLVTAPIILLQGTRRSIEAAWKYLVLCGVGIAFALLGTVFLLAAAGEGGSLGISWLTDHASSLRPSLLDAAFVFFLLGYGTKAGLFPVHNWLPDAHSEAPAPGSALLSGALLNCAMVALWRIGGIVEQSGSRGLLIALVAPMGAVTVLAAGVMLVRQRDLKRMWAYSSIENMGILAVAVGLRAAPVFALHALAHSLAKSSAFLLAGNVIRAFGTVSLSKLSGVMRRSPGLGFSLLAAGAAVMGAPPFASFVSEWLLLTNAAKGGHWGILATLTVGLAISFVAVMIHLGRIAFGEKSQRSDSPTTIGSILPAVLLLAVSAAAFVLVTPSALEAISGALGAGGRP